MHGLRSRGSKGTIHAENTIQRCRMLVSAQISGAKLDAMKKTVMSSKTMAMDGNLGWKVMADAREKA